MGVIKRIFLALTGVLAILVVLYLLLANAWMKRFAENALTSANGAEVNIAKFKHHLFPLRVEFSHALFTDPSTPMQNRLDIGNGILSLAFMPLLSGDIIITDMVLERVTTNSQRQSPGKVLPSSEEANLLVAMPSIDELLAKSPLQSTQASQQAYDAVLQQKEAIAKAQDDLPSRERLDYYRAEVDKLQQLTLDNPTAMAEAQKALQSLQNAIRQDKQKILNFKREAAAASDILNLQKERLKDAYESDYSMLSQLVTGDEATLRQVTSRLFGEQVADYLSYALSAAKFVAPYLQQDNEAKSTTDDGAAPFIWLQQARLSFFTEDLAFTGTMQNFSNDLSRTAVPASFKINSLTQGVIADIEGLFSQHDSGVVGKQSWRLSGIPLRELSAGNLSNLSVQLLNAVLASEGEVNFDNQSVIGKGSFSLSQLAMRANGEDKLANPIHDILSALENLSADLALSGSITDPKVSLRSDLDNQLAGALLTQGKSKAQDKLAELQTKLNNVIASPLADANAEQNTISTMLNDALGNEAVLDELLAAEVKGVIEKGKRKLLDKLTNKFNKP